MVQGGILRLQLFVGGVFLPAAKLLHLAEFEAAVHGFGVVPPRALPYLSGAIPLLELLCGSLLITGMAVMWGVWLGIGLVSLFLAVSSLALTQGRGGIDCYCFGAGGQPLGKATIFKQVAVLVLLGLLVLTARPIPLLSEELDGNLRGLAGVVVFTVGAWAVALVVAEFLRLRTISQSR